MELPAAQRFFRHFPACCLSAGRVLLGDLGLTHAREGPDGGGAGAGRRALLRIVMGILVDRLSPKKAAIIGQVIVLAALTYAWLAGVHSYSEVLVLGGLPRRRRCVVRRRAAAGLALVSAEHQGTAMGIAGAGQLGHRFAALLAPGRLLPMAGRTCSASR